MSSGLPSDTPISRRLTIFQSTAIALGVCLLFTAILYVAGRNVVLDKWQQSNENAKKVKEVSAKLSEAEARDKETQAAIAVLQQRAGSPTITDKELEELATQVKELLAARGKQDETLEEVSQQASTVQGDRARNRAQIVEAASTGNNVETELKALSEEITAWKASHESISRTNAGQKVAVFPDLVAKYEVLSNTPVVDFDAHDRWQEQLDAIYPRIKAAYENKEYVVVSEDDMKLLSDLLGKVRSSRKNLAQHHRSLKLIIASVKDTDPGQQTLEAAVAARQAERDAAYLDQLAKSRQAAADAVDAEYAAKIAEEQREQREILNKQRLQAEELQTQQKKKELDRIAGELEEVRKAREKAVLLQEFNRERAAIESLLAPFLDLAITQPSGTNPISKGGIRRPTSLGALRSNGALNDTNAGLDFLYHVGGHPANMRKKGGFPSFVSMSPIPNESVRQQVRRAQQLLLKYGELLVEKRMLSE